MDLVNINTTMQVEPPVMHIRKRRILGYPIEQVTSTHKTLRDIFLENMYVDDMDEVNVMVNKLMESYNIPPKANEILAEQEQLNAKYSTIVDDHKPTFAEYRRIMSKLSNDEVNEMYQKKFFLNTLQEIEEDYKDLIKIFCNFHNGRKDLKFNQGEKNYIQKQVFLEMLKQRKEEEAVNINLDSRISRNEKKQIYQNSSNIKLFLEVIAVQNNVPLDFHEIMSTPAHKYGEDSNERKLFLEAVKLHKEFEECFSDFDNIKKTFYQNWENSTQLNLLLRNFEKYKVAKEEIEHLKEVYKDDYSILKTDEYASKIRLFFDACELSQKLKNYLTALMGDFIAYNNSVLTELNSKKLERNFLVLFDLEDIYAVKTDEEALDEDNAIFKQRKIFLDGLKEHKEEFTNFAKILLNDNDMYRFTPTDYKMHILNSWQQIKNVFLEEFSKSMQEQLKLQSMLVKLKKIITSDVKFSDLSYICEAKFQTPESEKKKRRLNYTYPTPDNTPETTCTRTKKTKTPQPVNNSNTNEELNKSAVKITKADIAKMPADENGLVQIGPNGTTIPKSVLLDINCSQSAPSFARKIIVSVFDKVTLATHSLTGKPSPAFLELNMPKKKQLDPLKVHDITYMVKNCTNLDEKEIRASITTKCADEAKKLTKQRRQKETTLNSN